MELCCSALYIRWPGCHYARRDWRRGSTKSAAAAPSFLGLMWVPEVRPSPIIKRHHFNRWEYPFNIRPLSILLRYNVIDYLWRKGVNEKKQKSYNVKYLLHFCAFPMVRLHVHGMEAVWWHRGVLYGCTLQNMQKNEGQNISNWILFFIIAPN